MEFDMDGTKKTKRPKLKSLFSYSLLSVVFILLATGCSGKKKELNESIDDIQKREGVPVTVLKVQPKELLATENIGGTAEGFYQTSIVCNVPGQVAELYVSIGDYVDKGTKLMKIDPDMPSSLTMAKAQYDQAEKSKMRLDTLSKEGAVAQDLVDQVEVGYTVAKASLHAAQKTELVMAPFSGTVANIFYSEGNSIDRGKPLVDIATLEKIRIKSTVSEVIINKFKTGQKAFTRINDDTLWGQVSLVSISGQPMSHTFSVETVFPNPKHLLKPGMSASIEVIVERRFNILTLPIETVISEGTNRFVYIVTDGTAEKKPVQIGLRGGNSYEISSGLKEDDLIVASGSSKVFSGVKVKIINDDMPNK
jgi:RND family efflux transporter MFP subunit